jgi:hypothetical protein
MPGVSTNSAEREAVETQPKRANEDHTKNNIQILIDQIMGMDLDA